MFVSNKKATAYRGVKGHYVKADEMKIKYESMYKKAKFCIKELNSSFDSIYVVNRQINKHNEDLTDEEFVELMERVKEQLIAEGIIKKEI